MPEKWILLQYQSLPLQAKAVMSQNRIREWYQHWNGDVCISFSGGKDSTVLAHLVHDLYPHVPLVFANTGLEYPEIQEFARKMGAEFVRPKMSFSEVISTYGYPIISKENAEAIYYARRIRNSEGGVQGNTQKTEATATRKRLEINGSRTIGGGYNRPYHKTRFVTWRERKPPQKITGYRRKQILGTAITSGKGFTALLSDETNTNSICKYNRLARLETKHHCRGR